MNNFKRIMISAISALLCVSMVACGNNDVEDESTTTTAASDEVTTSAPTSDETTTSADETTTEAPVEDKVAIIEPQVDANTPGGKLWDAFLTAKKEKPETTAEEMANLMLTAGVIPEEISLGVMPLDPNQEFFTGFDNYTISGYESGAMFMPIIGTTPIVGYIFELPENADVDAFITNLSDNANLRWNICTAAEQMTVGAYGTSVFFLMCPNSFGA